jgi:hypothetical protein
MKHNRKIIISALVLFMTSTVVVTSLDIIPVAYATTTQTVLLTSPNSNTTAANQTPTPSNTGSNPTGLVICTGAKDTANPNDNRPICDFNYFLIEMRTVINWLFVIAIPIAIVLFAFGGILYILGTPGNRKKANGVFTATGIGFGIMLVAWVSVYTIVSWLTTGSNSSSSNPNGITTFLGQ